MKKELLLSMIIVSAFVTGPCLGATFTPIELPGGAVAPYGLSGDGSVVVGELTNNGWTTSLPFQWSQANGLQYGEFPDGAVWTWGDDASYDGTVLVGTTYNGTTEEALRWTEDTGFQQLGTVSGYDESYANATSGDASIIVGRSYTGSTMVAFRWTQADGMVSLGNLNGYPYCEATSISKDGSIIVGYCTTDVMGGDVKSFRWTAGENMTDLGLPVNYLVTQISADGTTVVGAYATEAGSGSFKYKIGTDPAPVDLGSVSGATEIEAEDVSGNGAVVVGWTNLGGFIWDETNGIRLLQDALVNEYQLDLGGWTIDEAVAISDDGNVIAGNGTPSGGGTQAWVASLSGQDNGGGGGGSGSGGGGGGGSACFIGSILP